MDCIEGQQEKEPRKNICKHYSYYPLITQLSFIYRKFWSSRISHFHMAKPTNIVQISRHNCCDGMQNAPHVQYIICAINHKPRHKHLITIQVFPLLSTEHLHFSYFCCSSPTCMNTEFIHQRLILKSIGVMSCFLQFK